MPGTPASIQFHDEMTHIFDQAGHLIVSAPTEKVVELYYGSVNHDEVYPSCVRWVSPRYDGFLLEFPPTVKEMIYEGETYQIPLPWTVWGVWGIGTDTISHTVGVRSYPVINPQVDELYHFPFPGIDKELEIDPDQDVLPGIIDGIEKFWAEVTPVSDDWKQHLDEETAKIESVSKFLVHLQGFDINQVLFTGFPTHMGYPTISHLLQAIINPSPTDDVSAARTSAEMIIDYFHDLVQKAAR